MKTIIQSIGYLAFLIIIIWLNYYIYTEVIYWQLLEIEISDSIDLLATLMTITTAVPTYFFAKLHDWQNAKLDIEKDKKLAVIAIKRATYEKLIPYLFIKNSYRNILSYPQIIEEARSIMPNVFPNQNIDFEIIRNSQSSNDTSPTNPAYWVYTFAQSLISQTWWIGHIYFPANILSLVRTYNSLNLGDIRHPDILFEILQLMREDIEFDNLGETARANVA
ncbi:hypothetical protein [Leptospira kmetyi]|uniref:Uncharacterized protein n=1 Tax=Leptospira kmetyi TaxID=408139 RepID=A0ABX4N6T5_9LEPT|nr:hypothetical protein [Leptospira kmetyi]PJZ29117.1 hypothetical protein CH378_14630 [Leptospira kmetyi]PJZ39716.1 hypothetical protein CH370_19885 [Leptospira kmetyi]